MIFLAVFAFQFPGWNFLLGLSLTVSGGFLMITESAEIVEVVRAPLLRSKPIRRRGKRTEGLHMKGFILQILQEAADTGLWDYEIMQAAFREFDREGDYWKGEIRATLTDLYSGALVEELEDDLDDGRYFGKDKILMKFTLTYFGAKRMAETGLS